MGIDVHEQKRLLGRDDVNPLQKRTKWDGPTDYKKIASQARVRGRNKAIAAYWKKKAYERRHPAQEERVNG